MTAQTSGFGFHLPSRLVQVHGHWLRPGTRERRLDCKCFFQTSAILFKCYLKLKWKRYRTRRRLYHILKRNRALRVWLHLIRCCAIFPPSLLLLLGFFFLIIICVGESVCCHCQSLTEGTMGPDRWKKQINSRPILEFEVLPWWHERTGVLGFCLLHWKGGQSLEDEQINKKKERKKKKQTGKVAFFSLQIILQCINSISMFI